VDIVITNSFSEFKLRALDLASRVDAFFVLNHDTFVDDLGKHVDMLEVGRWYLENINKPEVAPEPQFIREGMLATASDSGFNQSFKAFEIAYDILEQGLNPSRIRTVVPPKGPLMVNRNRAVALGVSLAEHEELIDEIIEESVALKR
jgi:ABC-type uncharacterized transport system substrate-binding protein